MKLAVTVVLLMLSLVDGALAQDRLVILSGLGGEPQYREEFHSWVPGLVDRANSEMGTSGVVHYLAARPDQTPVPAEAKSTGANIESLFSRLAEEMTSEDQLFVILIGHGSQRGAASRVNLPGPDLTAADYGRLLAPIRASRVVFVNLASASGDFITHLSGPNRTIVTATKSSRERNWPVFGRFFVAAFTEGGADTNKDGRVSVVEAFQYAVHEVERYYESDQRLLTEHALLDDNGDGVGHTALGPDSGDGAIAARLFLGSGRAEVVGTADPETRRLEEQKATLEREVAELRAKKSELNEDEYQRRLEDLLLRLARINREIRNRR